MAQLPARRVLPGMMRFSTKLGIAGLLTGAALAAMAIGIARLQETATKGLASNVSPSFPDAVISIDLLSWASLATGITALLYTLYHRLRRQPSQRIAIEESTPTDAIPRQRLGLRGEFLLVL